MRKAVKMLFILASGCIAALGQTPAACEAQLHHFSVPKYTPLLHVRESYRKAAADLASRFLFAENGIEVYSGLGYNAFNDPDSFLLPGNVSSQERVLIVYQEEVARQAQIKRLRVSDILPPLGFGALVTNLKYVEVVFQPYSFVEGDPFAEKWHIASITYYQPRQCQNVFQNDNHPTLGNAYTGTVNKIAYTDETKDVRLPLEEFPLYARALRAVLVWMQQCARLYGK